MNQDVFGEVLAAMSVARGQGKFANYSGLPSPLLQVGKLKFPQHLSLAGGSITTTPSRYYDIPIFIDRIESFSGVKFHNSGTGNSGHKVKVAIYDESDIGGAGALAKDFGEVTLDGAATLRTLSSSWTPTKVGWYYLRLATDSAVGLWGMAGMYRTSDAGFQVRNDISGLFSVFASTFSANFTTGQYGCDYAAGSYSGFPEATAVASTVTVDGATYSGNVSVPAVALYK